MPVSGYVYIIQAVGTKRYKIGRARDPNKRFETLKQQSAFPLKLIATFYTEDFVAHEKRLHSLATVYRIHGEWFELPNHWIESLEDWFYNTACKKYKGGVERGNLICILSAFDDLPVEAFPEYTTAISLKSATYEQVERAICLLGNCSKGAKLTAKKRRELISIIGAYPGSEVEAAIWKAKLKSLEKQLRQSVCKVLR